MRYYCHPCIYLDVRIYNVVHNSLVTVDEVVGKKLESELREASPDPGADKATMRPLGGDEDLVKLLGNKYDCAIEDLGSWCVAF